MPIARQSSDFVAMFEFFDHTADIGLRVRAADLNTLFAESGRALFSLIVDNLDALQPRNTQTIELHADKLEDLFFDWLSELLYLFAVRRLVLCRFDVRIDGPTLKATVAGESVDPTRHLFAHEVKAVTYHALRVQQNPDGWLAEVILDI
jgi:SHS2 domain-containing protein